VFRQLGPQRWRDLPHAEPHHSVFDNERPIGRRCVWTQVAGWTLLPLLLGTVTLATFVFRQDISLMITLHQLGATDGTSNIYRIEYLDDLWVLVQLIEPFELKQPDASERPVLPVQAKAFQPMLPSEDPSTVTQIREAAGLIPAGVVRFK